ncbi:MAG: hypothetical protein QXO15_05090 [Nitrososphaerota archaeon]
MPKILGLTISWIRLALRIVLAITSGAISFTMFYLIPSTPAFILGQLERFMIIPKEVSGILASLARQFIDPIVPIIGLMLTIAIPIGIVLSKTKVHGPLIIITNVLFACYIYTLLRGGFISLSLPSGLPLGLTGQVILEVPFIIRILTIPIILNILKGILVTVKSLTNTP